ncbi:MAG: response regulator [Deltaproteobacteria bacterium]|nr:response regulator [Deltaproteobacteria bacterium]
MPGDPEPAEPAPVGTGVRRVLVVDDNLINRMVTGRMLDKLGVEHVSANDGAEALKRVRDDAAFGLVLMDCEVPVMDGFAATRRIRTGDGPLADVPIVGLRATCPSKIASVRCRRG